MLNDSEKIEVALEIGKKRTFASTLRWPGWSRSGKDERTALDNLCLYGERYAQALKNSQLDFYAPSDISAFTIFERLAGNATTDFGAPGIAPTSDGEPVSDDDLNLLQTLLEAYWKTFDHATQQASGRKLIKGPRGGGRDLEEIIRHVLGADAAYLKRIGWKFTVREDAESSSELRRVRAAITQALAASAKGELPTQGPRGGAYWSTRYFARRSGWHVLDHAWEIEDRIH